MASCTLSGENGDRDTTAHSHKVCRPLLEKSGVGLIVLHWRVLVPSS